MEWLWGAVECQDEVGNLNVFCGMAMGCCGMSG